MNESQQSQQSQQSQSPNQSHNLNAWQALNGWQGVNAGKVGKVGKVGNDRAKTLTAWQAHQSSQHPEQLTNEQHPSPTEPKP